MALGTEDSCGAGGPTFVFLGLRWKLPQHALIDPFLLPFPVFLFLCLHSRPPWQALFFLWCWAARPRSVLGSPCVWGCVCCLVGCDASSARAQLHRAWFTLFSFLFKALNSFQSPPLSHADSSCALCCPALPFHWVSSQRMWGCQLVPVGWWWVRVGPPMAQGMPQMGASDPHTWVVPEGLPSSWCEDKTECCVLVLTGMLQFYSFPFIFSSVCILSQLETSQWK